MSKILKRLNRELETYMMLLTNYQKRAKSNKYELFNDASKLLSKAEEYVDGKKEELDMWIKLDIELDNMQIKGPIHWLKKLIWKEYVKHYMLSVVKELDEGRYLVEQFQFVTRKLNWYINAGP